MSTNPFTKVSKWADDVKARASLNQRELKITKPYYAKLVIEEKEAELLDTPRLREFIRNRLSPLLKSAQTANAFVDYLARADDLTNFYRLEAPFLRSIQGVHRLDLTYLTNLWVKYRTAVLKEVERLKSIEVQADLGLSKKQRIEAFAPTPIGENETLEQEGRRIILDLDNSIVPLNKNTGRPYASKQKAEDALKKITIDNEIQNMRTVDERYYDQLLSK